MDELRRRDRGRGKLADLLNKNSFELKQLVTKSIAWFDQKALELRPFSVTPARTILRAKTLGENNRSAIIPGSMYLYIYDPLTKDTLPYYDVFPLVLPFRRQGMNFWGLNLHYLHYRMRVNLLDHLIEVGATTGMDENKRIRASWSLIESSAKLTPAVACVKQYRLDRVRSMFRLIEPEDWASVCLLPIDHFVGATRQKVWEESLMKVRKAYGGVKT